MILMYLNVRIICKTLKLKQNWKLIRLKIASHIEFDSMRQAKTIYNKNVLQTLGYG